MTAVLGLLASQTLFVPEINAAIRSEVECRVIGEDRNFINRECCEFVVDTETGERTEIGCWFENCYINEQGVEEDCVVNDVPELPSDSPLSEQPLGQQQEVLPVPPIPEDSTPGGITKGPPDEQKVLPTPQETTRFGDGVTGRIPDQAEVLPIPQETTSQDDNGTPDPPSLANIFERS